MKSRNYFHQDSAAITALLYSSRCKLLVAGLSTGMFGLFELPYMSNVHKLSILNQSVRSACIDPTGKWLAFGCPSSMSPQLLVCEWRSETYVIKQRGHGYGMRCMLYSPDGVALATKGEDGTLNIWIASLGLASH